MVFLSGLLQCLSLPKIFAAPSPQAVELADSLDLIGGAIDAFASKIFPVGASLLFFVLVAYVIKRFIYAA